MRGDHFKFSIALMMLNGSPPLARGPQGFGAWGKLFDRITPACAGTTAGWSSRQVTKWDHPRLRGDHHVEDKRALCQQGSPPLARGPLSYVYVEGKTHRITPACAGTTKWVSDEFDGSKDHPRLRGDHTRRHPPISDAMGSPPLARGPPASGLSIGIITRITPACAGTTL